MTEEVSEERIQHLRDVLRRHQPKWKLRRPLEVLPGDEENDAEVTALLARCLSACGHAQADAQAGEAPAFVPDPSDPFDFAPEPQHLLPKREEAGAIRRAAYRRAGLGRRRTKV